MVTDGLTAGPQGAQLRDARVEGVERAVRLPRHRLLRKPVGLGRGTGSVAGSALLCGREKCICGVCGLLEAMRVAGASKEDRVTRSGRRHHIYVTVPSLELYPLLIDTPLCMKPPSSHPAHACSLQHVIKVSTSMPLYTKYSCIEDAERLQSDICGEVRSRTSS